MKIIKIAFLITVLLSTTYAHANVPITIEYGNDPNSRIMRLEQDLQMLQKVIYKNTPSYPTATTITTASNQQYEQPSYDSTQSTARLGIKIQELEQQLSALVGRIEKIEYKLNQIHSQKGPKPSPPSLNNNAVSTIPNYDGTLDIQVQDTNKVENLNENLSVTEEYDRAHALLTQAEYQKAATAFSQFITKHGDHKLASNAYYWLGETYMIKKDYTRAAEQFLSGYKNFPNGNKAADNLLKLGIAMRSLGKNIEACAVFSKLRRNIDPIAGFIEKRMATEEKALNCR